MNCDQDCDRENTSFPVEQEGGGESILIRRILYAHLIKKQKLIATDVMGYLDKTINGIYTKENHSENLRLIVKEAILCWDFFLFRGVNVRE